MSMFAPIPGQRSDDNVKGTLRTFKGEGSPHLKVPGLKGMPYAVRVGTTDIPERIEAHFIENKLNGKTVASDLPLLASTKDIDGVQVLQRSMFSNDGIWQRDQDVHVWADWDGDPVPKDTAKAK